MPSSVISRSLCLFVVLVASLPACTRVHASAPRVINIGNGAEPKDLDPAIVTGIPEYRILMNLFEALVSKDPKTLEPIPGVAESWKISKDHKTYTFKLRQNAKWSNGDPVTAQDFVYSWTRLLLPATASEYASMGYFFKNGKAFNTGKLKDSGQLGFKALDPQTLEVTLEYPTPFFLSILHNQSLYPVHKATVEKFGQRWTRPENMVSNGAYGLSAWEVNRVISLKKSPSYWDRERVALDQANFYGVENLNTEEKMFRSRELDITYEVPLEKIPGWQKDKTGAYQQTPYLGTYFYWFNVKKPPLDNLLVRQALNLAIDREKLVKYVTRGGQLPGTVFTPPGAGGFEPQPLLPKDLSQLGKAKELLAKAGYPNGKGFPPLEILYNTSESHKKIAEAIQAMLKQNLGIDVKLFNQEWKVYLDNQTQHNFQMTRAGWIGDYNDPYTFLDMFLTGDPLNHAQWSNKTFDNLIAQAAREMDLKKRLDIFQAAEKILLTELPVLPIYIYTRVYLRSPRVEGWYNNIEDTHPLKYVSLRD